MNGGGMLVTNNPADFAAYPGVIIENWVAQEPLDLWVEPESAGSSLVERILILYSLYRMTMDRKQSPRGHQAGIGIGLAHALELIGQRVQSC